MRVHDIEFNDDDLVSLWHSEQPMAQIAAKLGIEANELQGAWRHLKRKSRLPYGDRPRQNREGFDNAYDGRPKVSSMHPGSDDPLLARLYQKHKPPTED